MTASTFHPAAERAIARVEASAPAPMKPTLGQTPEPDTDGEAASSIMVRLLVESKDAGLLFPAELEVEKDVSTGDREDDTVSCKGKSNASVAVSVLMGSQRPPELGEGLTPRTGGWRAYDTTAGVRLQRVVGDRERESLLQIARWPSTKD